MKTLLALALVLTALTGCAAPTATSPDDRISSFDGGVLRVRYPTDGNKDIFILVNRDGSVADVIGGATSVSNFRLSRSALAFDTKAVTSAGERPMKFELGAVAEGSWVGEYSIGGGCTNECLRTGAASWEKGGELVSLPDA